jgi:hypothetical protein
VPALGIEPRRYVPAGGSSYRTYRVVPATPLSKQKGYLWLLIIRSPLYLLAAVKGTPLAPGVFWIYSVGFIVNWPVLALLIQGHFA